MYGTHIKHGFIRFLKESCHTNILKYIIKIVTLIRFSIYRNTYVQPCESTNATETTKPTACPAIATLHIPPTKITLVKTTWACLTKPYLYHHYRECSWKLFVQEILPVSTKHYVFMQRNLSLLKARQNRTSTSKI